MPIQSDHDYCAYPNMVNFSKFKKEAVSYIAGYVGKMTKKKTHCGTRPKVLGFKEQAADDQGIVKGKIVGDFSTNQCNCHL